MNIRDIKLNEKYTIVASGSDCLSSVMCDVVKCTIKDIQLVQYAQYETALQIRYRGFRQRKDQILTIVHESISILKGYHNIDRNFKKSIDENLTELIPNKPENYFNDSNLVYKKDKGLLTSYDSFESIVDITGDYLKMKVTQV